MACTAAILDFLLAWFYLFFIYSSTCCNIVSINLIRFARRCPKQIFKMAAVVAILEFRIDTILAHFDP